MAIPTANFGLVTVSTGYSSGATSIALQSGDGSRLPSTFPYPLTWWNATDYSHAALDPNREIVYVTNRSGDTLTITRAQENTSASAKNTAGKTYYMALVITRAMWESLARPKSFHQALQLQTHRDADLAASRVELVDVDSIIMDDGTELRNDNGEWSGKSADITASGAGGLDTGVELTSTWYEIYAIAKEDGTRNLVLHASKIWLQEINVLTGDDADQGIRSAVDNSTVKVAQGFSLDGSGPGVLINVKLRRVGAPTGQVWFTVESDSGGKPSGAVLATSQAYDVSRLPTSSIMIRMPIKSSSALSNSTQYHLVAQGNWTISATNYVAWRMDTSSPPYPNGSKALFDSDTSTWTTVSGHDMLCMLAAENLQSAVIMPAGYTKKCFLGWVFNNASNDFVQFMQAGRSIRFVNLSTTNNRAWQLTGAAELVDLYAHMPPIKLCRVSLGLSGTGSSGALAAIGDLRATDLSSSGTSTGAQAIMATAITSQMPSQFADVIVQHNAIMAMGTSGAWIWVTGFEF